MLQRRPHFRRCYNIQTSYNTSQMDWGWDNDHEPSVATCWNHTYYEHMKYRSAAPAIDIPGYLVLTLALLGIASVFQ